jgi:KaiC/GvpD/RAD55 family RecA-like ATPase
MDLIESIYQKQKEAERVFAAAAFTDPRYVIEKCGWLDPAMIVDERIRKFWQLVQAGEDPVAASFQVGLAADLMGWAAYGTSFLSAPEYAAEIARQAWLAGVGSQLPDLAGAISRGDVGRVQEVVEKLNGHKIAGARRPPNAAEIAEKFKARVEAGNRSILTGIPGLDNNTGGLERQTESILAARPSMGKTALALQIGRNVAVQKKRVVIDSLEMSDVSLWARMACPRIGVTWMDVRAGKLTDEQKERLYEESQKLAETFGEYLTIDDSSNATVDQVWRTAAEVRADLVIVDHLGLMSGADDDDKRVQELGRLSWRLKAMAKDLDLHVMVLHQLNRKVEERKDKRPLLSDLRDSGELEQNADQVFMVYRDDYYHPQDPPAQLSETELWVRKFRDGVKDARIVTYFDEKEQWFYGKDEIGRPAVDQYGRGYQQ